MSPHESSALEEGRPKKNSRWGLKSHKDKLIFAKSLCIAVALLVIALTSVYVQTINEFNNSMYSTLDAMQEERFDQIYIYIMELRKMASENANEVALDIEQDIRSQLDLEKLKMDLDNGITNDNLYTVFRQNISGVNFNGVNNQRNGIFITSTVGILEDMNYDRACVEHHDEIRTWDNEIAHAYNSYLESDAISKLLSHSNEIIMTEHVNILDKEDSNYDSHSIIKSPTYDAIKTVYINEGIVGLKNYQFLNPAYILDTKDIFGQPDIIEGHLQKTHTFIVVQEFNIYDQLKMHYPEIMDDSYLDATKLQYHNVLNILYIIGVIYGAIMVVLFSVVSNKFNNYFDKHNLGDIEPKKHHVIE